MLKPTDKACFGYRVATRVNAEQASLRLEDRWSSLFKRGEDSMGYHKLA